jgi:hypothetical protein
MLLMGVRDENGWLASTFNLTYPASWEKICKAVNRTYEFFEDTEILVDGVVRDVDSKDDILNFAEAGSMTIRGMSTIIEVPLMITFFNQLKTVNVAAACITEEFKDADYQKFNMSLGEFMDSIELSMYVK